MYRTGALLVSSSKVLLPALTAASKLISGVLYVPLAYHPRPSEQLELDSDRNKVYLYDTLQQIKCIYFHASKHCPLLDVRVLLPTSITAPQQQQKYLSHFNSTCILEYGTLDIILSHVPSLQEVKCLPGYLLLAGRIKPNEKMVFEKLKFDDISSISPINATHTPINGTTPTDYDAAPIGAKHDEVRTFSDVALGGTFDNIHNGHRLLLAQSALLAEHRVLVGVSSGPLLTNKVLMELIKPLETRLFKVDAFLRDIKPGLKREVVPITDIYGPTAWDQELDGLVVSHETARGGEMVNQEREEKGLRPLLVHVVDLIDRSEEFTLAQEQKLSSSDIRRSMLGSYREAEESNCLKSYDPSGPYLIGLTGGIATGKSSIVKRLTAIGAYAIDCDKLGHLAYEPGTSAFSELVAEFGKDIVSRHGSIDRKHLGSIVFGSKAKLQRLNEIVWPEILHLVQDRIAAENASGHRVCVVDAAVLLQAGWQEFVHEVWVTIAPVSEVIKRVIERDGVSEESAEKRLEAQITNAERVRYANVIFSTQWEPEYTQKQVEKAWRELQERIAARAVASKM